MSAQLWLTSARFDHWHLLGWNNHFLCAAKNICGRQLQMVTFSGSYFRVRSRQHPHHNPLLCEVAPQIHALYLALQLLGHALHEEVLHRQWGDGPLVSRQESRGAVGPQISRLSTSRQLVVNRLWCSLIRFTWDFMATSEGMSRQLCTLFRGRDGMSGSGRTAQPTPTLSCPARPSQAQLGPARTGQARSQLDPAPPPPAP